jgi:hypothetical protein
MIVQVIRERFIVSSTTLVFFGLRFEIADDEIEALERRSHPAIVMSIKFGLDHYWGNFGSPAEQYFLFIGRLLAKLGVEDRAELQIDFEALSTTVRDVSSLLMKARISELPRLYMQFQPD